MRRAIATVCLSGLLPDKLQAAAAARFDGVEIFENDLLQFPGSAADVRRMAADLGITIDLFQPFRDFDAATPRMLARNLERAERKFDLMAELGTRMLLVCSNVQPDALGDPALLAEQFAQLAERAEQRGMYVSYEALAWGTKVNRFAQAWEVVKRVNHPHLGLTLDSFHTLAVRDDPAPIAQLPGEKIFFVQLADAPWVNTDVLSHSRHYRCFPGQGEMEVTRFTRAVVDAGYTGPLSLEVFNDEFRSTSARANAVDAMRSLLWLEDQVRHAAPADALKVPLFDPPAAPPLAGWGFVEFAVDPASGARMAGWLQSMGFARIGTHKSKDVQLYGQGEVRLVLNLEADSPARSHFDLHGPSVCALALTTPDQAATLARAEALLSPRVTGHGAQELSIPAVRAPDGSLLHVCAPPVAGRHAFEAFFDIDEAALRATPAGAAARIDHVVQAVPAGQVEPWLLFHRAVLGLSAERQVVLHDPYGVIRSRELESADRAVRVSITVSERENTSTSRSVSQFRGAGVQQIAVHVDDLVATARALQAAGAPLLPVPANYYDDIEAKFDIDAARLADLRALGILYDREPGGGEFLQLYLAPFEERFHFELVQRIGGYAGYGAANAPVRLAAMALWRDSAPP
ncbi:bifunctional sugar phosphate isomerase/epimerase/4-hydroxyphenylpyruvate dioxygenase family protein [Pseudorhodoferax sp. Leaf267]|uniref:bifunctional sugar phosphate isomerase/epimerase/4-hydroxyphenylpyruvate dioxygenase family protein n=1 Tax=Pseudorhodoferax sp. Leaf267 TaxID=1736316 RepID=UPI000700C8A6|nr:sugar phosphate isomerase/epimerase and 4-hydroxyphenylpyruvate domain-containing protein [Pseudorhodoferax sp. Leaf267]KQP12679.1 4-hydroxyphenylpyruvate dioxygenase [Pseudorhodoferax sp. Leaf267]